MNMQIPHLHPSIRYFTVNVVQLIWRPSQKLETDIATELQKHLIITATRGPRKDKWKGKHTQNTFQTVFWKRKSTTLNVK